MTLDWQDYIVHECAPRFNAAVLHKHLKGYTMHQLTVAEGQPLYLSPHCFGWPCHRPRNYTLFTKDSSRSLDLEGSGIDLIKWLFRKPILPVSSLWCAPEVGDLGSVVYLQCSIPFNTSLLPVLQLLWKYQFKWCWLSLFAWLRQADVSREREWHCHKNCRPLQSPFSELLGGASNCLPSICLCQWLCWLTVCLCQSSAGSKRVYLSNYRSCTKVKKTFAKVKHTMRLYPSDGKHCCSYTRCTCKPTCFQFHPNNVNSGQNTGINHPQQLREACMVANLDQNPNTRPICSVWSPALLKQGCMWLLRQKVRGKQPRSSSNNVKEERWLLPKDAWAGDLLLLLYTLLVSLYHIILNTSYVYICLV